MLTSRKAAKPVATPKRYSVINNINLIFQISRKILRREKGFLTPSALICARGISRRRREYAFTREEAPGLALDAVLGCSWASHCRARRIVYPCSCGSFAASNFRQDRRTLGVQGPGICLDRRLNFKTHSKHHSIIFLGVEGHEGENPDAPRQAELDGATQTLCVCSVRRGRARRPPNATILLSSGRRDGLSSFGGGNRSKQLRQLRTQRQLAGLL